MQFVVGQQLREPVGSVTRYDVREAKPFPDEDDSVSDVAGTVEMMRTDKGILVSASLDCRIAGRCSRCLTEISYRLPLTFQEEYLPTVDPLSEEALPQPDEPDTFLIDGHQVLDLREAVRQYRMLVEPMQPLCQADCLGLCPRCGYDLNQGPCECPGQDTDDRWAALAELAEKLEQE
ncbi:MAG: DUF177 domain-containing protein [Chloroflexota bacterium]|nr:DUF177 domain-containing protein [Chloroflexota bacterium]